MTTRAVVELGTFVAIYIREGGGSWHAADSHWDEIDAALHQYVERGIDRVLMLTVTNGADLMLSASRISEAFRSTPESREIQRKIDEAMKTETGFSE